MKSACFTAIFCLLILEGYSQHAQSTFALTVSGTDRIAVVKSSVHLAEWHEKAFWPLYERYLSDATTVCSETYRSLRDLAETDLTVSDQEAFDNGWKLLTSRNEELQLKKKYYHEVGSALNGVVALEFIQTEAMMDMLESANIYAMTRWKNYRFHSQSLPRGDVKRARHNTLASAMSLSPDKEQSFWALYSRYEEECDALLGESYNVYGLFAGDASDFTPALAKRLGNELLQVMEREIRLKERYFLEINATVGSSIAAQFLAWEDYHSIVSKMHAWAEGN